MGISPQCTICTPSPDTPAYSKISFSLSHGTCKPSLMETPISQDKPSKPELVSIYPKLNNSLTPNFSILRFSNNSWFKGSIFLTKANGWGKFLHPKNGRYEGHYKNDKPEGYGIYVHLSNSSYEGEWKNEKQDGYGIEKWSDGSVYKGYFILGKKNGLGRYTFTNGEIYYGEWFDNKMNGYGFLINFYGDLYLGQCKDNLKHGYGEIYAHNNCYFWGNFIEGEKNGFFIFYNVDKMKIILGFYNNGKMNGLCKIFNGNGKEGNFYNVEDGIKKYLIEDINDIHSEINRDNVKYLKFFKLKRKEIERYINMLISDMDINSILKLLGKGDKNCYCCCMN